MMAAEVQATRIGCIRLVRIDDGSTQSLRPAIEQTVSSGTVGHTDAWKGYRFLASRVYLHEIIRPSEELGDNLLPHCHRVASLLKRWMLGTRQGAIAPEHLEYYLDEFTFRLNRRTSQHRGKIFYRLVPQTSAIEPNPYKDRVKHVRGRKSLKHNP